MSKKVKQEMDVNVNDNRSLSKLGADAKKAGKNVGSVARNIQDSDRRLKSLSQQTSNSTKAFSKQAQTMQGGIVPIYATLAAQVFAVTAAFQFFQNSVDFANLIKGQEAFGAVTGVAYASLTKNIQAATQNQLSYSEAAQAAAIGTAAGLTSSQLTEIGVAAKNTSLALGRNLTDSFNRLTRGITKAEPELLDELGIVLRLEPALKAYAAQIGKNATQLNQFEKSQAIANEVLGQAERKFSKAAQEIDEGAFALAQFRVAFGELVENFQVGLAKVLLPTLGFLKDNIIALSGALVLFARPIVASLIDFENMGKAAVKNTAIAAAAVEKAQGRMDRARFAGDNVGARRFAAAGMEDVNRQIGRGKFENISAMAGGTGQMSAKMLRAERMALMKNGELHKKITTEAIARAKKRYEIEGRLTKKATNFARREQMRMRKDYIRHLKIMEGALRTSKAKQKGIESKYTTYYAFANAQRVLIFAKAQKAMVAIAKFSARAINIAFAATGIIGIGALLYGIGQSIMDAFSEEKDENVQKITERLQEQTEAARTLNEELQRMNRFRAEGRVAAGTETSQQFANMIRSTGTASENIRQFEERKSDTQAAGLSTEMGIVGDPKRIEQLNTLIERNTRLLDSKNKHSAAAAAERLERFKTEKAELSKLVFSNEEYGSSIETQAANIEQLAEAAHTAELANMYRELAKAIRSGTLENFEFTEELKKQEDQIIDTSDKVSRAEEINKTFLRSMQGLTGKGGPFAQQRTALRESVAGQDALIRSFTQGGGDIESDEGVMMVEKKVKLASLQDRITTAVKTENQNARDIIANDIERLKLKTAITEEAKLETLEIKKLKDVEKIAAAEAALERAEIKQQSFDLSEVTKETIEDTKEEIAQLKEKVKLAEEDKKVNDELLEVERRKLELKIAQNHHTAAQKAIEGEILAMQMGNARGNAFLSGTKIGSRLVKEQKIEEDKLRIRKEAANITFLESQLDKERQDLGASEIAKREADIDFQKNKLALMEEQNRVAEEQMTFVGELQNTFAKGIENMFIAIGTGAKSAKDAFRDMAIFMLQKMAEMAAQQLALKALGFMGLPIPLAEGGVIGLAKGGIMPKYRSGGIATEPTYLVGEGRMNEAVVPLPDGRSIPVNMKGQAQSNNIVVNVDANGGTQTNMDGAQGAALGKAIAATVMETIQREKRPGGVLSR